VDLLLLPGGILGRSQGSLYLAFSASLDWLMLPVVLEMATVFRA